MKADETAWLGKVLLYILDNQSGISKSMVEEENLHMRAVHARALTQTH